ncbi:Wzz/FepE/Etk N-terminal domain-containing protein [Hydrogenimonas thermophila]|uniref:Chain length determinant protein n=1 Tax=Hydrogenimonas thermophila TaxID=223786 RepID=A0A1I5KRF9_9BACT|nr:Wzz/FepE/Etk N-terminal domain-containing protein [Hydrogenimonas thermophila]SFO87585.1 Chain length determinant protein [Hydrogenimonas thermophila]
MKKEEMMYPNQPYPPVCIDDEDEIDLRELGRTIWKYRWKLLLFTIIVTFITVLSMLAKPNTYTSSAKLIPQEKQRGLPGGLSSLASLAGIDVGGGGGSLRPDEALNALANDYKFMREFLLRNKFFDRLNSPDADKNYVFAFGYDGIYRLLHSKDKKTEENKNIEDSLFNAYKQFSKKLSISSDKKSSLITISFKDPDRFLARDVVLAFLQDASKKLKENDLSDIKKKIAYYKEELAKTTDASLKKQLSDLISALIQKEVLAKSSKYYNVKLFTPPEVPYVKDKTGPKRGLVVIVAFITSIILGIFGIFFIEFLRGESEKESND